jgi:hypothetical protein
VTWDEDRELVYADELERPRDWLRRADAEPLRRAPTARLVIALGVASLVLLVLAGRLF